MNVSIIREFKEDDIEGIIKVYRSWWAGEDQKITELVASKYFDPNGLFVTEKNGEIVGFAYAYVDARIVSRLGQHLGFLAGIFTLPNARAVASELLEKSLHYLKELKATEVEIPDFGSSLGDGVSAEKDSELYKLYIDAGFKIYTHSYEMSRSLENLKVPQWIKKRRDALLDGRFILRKAKKDDALALVKIYNEAFKDSYNYMPQINEDIEETINEIVKEIDLHIENTVLFEKDRKIVGFSDFSTEKYKEKIIGYPCVAVLPDYRKKGLGTVLFWDTLERLKESSVPTAGINVVGTNYPAIHLYRKAGFNIDKVWYHLRKPIYHNNFQIHSY